MLVAAVVGVCRVVPGIWGSGGFGGCGTWWQPARAGGCCRACVCVSVCVCVCACVCTYAEVVSTSVGGGA